MKYIHSLSKSITVTGLGLLLIVGISGCSGCTNEDQHTQQAQIKQGAFVIIEETAPNQYKIKEEFPAEETRIVLKKLDGTQKVLTQEEMDTLVKQEAAKIDNGTSPLTQPQMSQVGGMGLGEALLASAAGVIVGSWIGSKLFGNSNYQNNRQAGYSNPSAYSRSQNSFNQARSVSSSTSSTKKSGFFGNKSSSSSSKISFGG